MAFQGRKKKEQEMRQDLEEDRTRRVPNPIPLPGLRTLTETLSSLHLLNSLPVYREIKRVDNRRVFSHFYSDVSNKILLLFLLLH